MMHPPPVQLDEGYEASMEHYEESDSPARPEPGQMGWVIHHLKGW